MKCSKCNKGTIKLIQDVDYTLAFSVDEKGIIVKEECKVTRMGENSYTAVCNNEECEAHFKIYPELNVVNEEFGVPCPNCDGVFINRDNTRDSSLMADPTTAMFCPKCNFEVLVGNSDIVFEGECPHCEREISVSEIEVIRHQEKGEYPCIYCGKEIPFASGEDEEGSGEPSLETLPLH